MMNKEFLITSFITVIIAFVGYFAKYFNDLRIAKRKDKLERINRQLKELYGPLFSLTSSSNATWNEFRSKYRSKHDKYFDKKNPPSCKEKKIWRIWISNVFQPINEEKYKLIIENGDLIIENVFPKPLKDLCAHYESYKPIIKQWEKGNYKEHLGLIDYPKDLLIYARTSYEYLKEEQSKLID